MHRTLSILAALAFLSASPALANHHGEEAGKAAEAHVQCSHGADEPCPHKASAAGCPHHAKGEACPETCEHHHPKADQAAKSED